MTFLGQLRLPILFAITGTILAGCSLFEDSSTISYTPIPAASARLVFNEDKLVNAPVRFKLAERTSLGHRVEHGRWEGLRGEQAELLLTETLTSHGINAQSDPRDLVGEFSGLVQVKAAFGDLYRSDTGAGPAIWRRFVAGDRSCVIFSQRWDSGSGTPVTRILTGYYCAKPGGTYTIQDAQRTLLTINLKPR